MDGDTIIRAIWEATASEPSHRRGSTQTEMKAAMTEILQNEGLYVVASDAELRALALVETDLVEPSDE